MIGKRASLATAFWSNNINLILAAIFLALIAGAGFVGKLPFAVFGFYGVASASAFVAYALDKSAARNNRWRIRENSLHFFALIGGWPGAIVAQNLLRHKTRKREFQIMFWATIVLNCAALSWLISPAGAGALHFVRQIYEQTP